MLQLFRWLKEEMARESAFPGPHCAHGQRARPQHGFRRRRHSEKKAPGRSRQRRRGMKRSRRLPRAGEPGQDGRSVICALEKGANQWPEKQALRPFD